MSSVDKLEIVNYQQVQPTLGLEPAGFASKLHDVLERRFIDIQRQVRQQADGVQHPGFLILSQEIHPESVAVHIGL